jgi:hypothetical protein
MVYSGLVEKISEVLGVVFLFTLAKFVGLGGQKNKVNQIFLFFKQYKV